MLARELYPGRFRPTVSHAFISLLAKKDLLYKLFTQNIDCLERAAGVPADKIIEAHGSFATQRCIECRRDFPDEEMLAHVEKGSVPRCKCGGLVKPDIVFFGEGLPMEFSRSSGALAEADLVLILGTSLTVYPFAALPEMCRPKTPRVLFNMEQVGDIGERADDVLELGPCDVGVLKFAEELGWLEELNALWTEMVGEEEVGRQRRRQGVAGEDLKKVEDEIVESLTAQVEGIDLKGGAEEESETGDRQGAGKGSEKGEGEGLRSDSVQGKETAEECEAEDREALEADTPLNAGTAGGETSPGLEKHLEMHLHQKTAFGAKLDGADEATAEGTTATDEKPAEKKPAGEAPAQEKPAADEPAKDRSVEDKPVEGEPDESKSESKNEAEKSQEKL